MKTYRNIALALLTLGLTACQQEEDFVPQEQEIRVAFTTDAIKTRVNTLDTGDQWEPGDKIHLTRLSGDQLTDYFYTAEVANDGTVTWTPDKKLYWDGKDAQTLVASYPNMDLSFERFGIPSEQNTLSGLKEADCMNARWIGTPTSETISLNLKHRMSMVTVTYTLASEFDSNVEIVPQVYSKAQYIIFSKADGLPMTTSVGQYGIWVNAYMHEEVDADDKVVSKKFTAIVSPDAYAAGDEFIRVTIGDRVLTAKMQEAITFAEGTHYTFDLKVGKDYMAINSVSVAEWGNGGETDKVVAEECTHSWNHDDEYSVCTICGLECIHWLEGGICPKCGKEETQNN